MQGCELPWTQFFLLLKVLFREGVLTMGIDEIKLGGTYSNQVATLEAKIDALTLDVRSMEDKLDIVLIGLGHKCNCGGVLHEGCGNDGDEVA